MYINVEKFKNLIINEFDNNLHQCARALDINPSTICRIVNSNSNGGTKFFGNFMNYCKTNGLDFNEFIFLPEPLRETNTNHKGNIG